MRLPTADTLTSILVPYDGPSRVDPGMPLAATRDTCDNARSLRLVGDIPWRPACVGLQGQMTSLGFQCNWFQE